MSELVHWLQNNFAETPRVAAYNFIKNRRRAGRLAVVKEGLCFLVRPGATAATTPLDDFLLASKLAPDAMLAFHNTGIREGKGGTPWAKGDNDRKRTNAG